MKLGTVIVILSITICSCSSLKTMTPEYISANSYTSDFQPIPPIRTDKLSYKDKDEKIANLTGFSSYVTIERISADGKIEYSKAATITGAAGSYKVIMDFIAYDIVPINDNKNNLIAYGREGAGLRVTANISTVDGGINVSGLSNLAVEAKASRLSGTLLVDVIGISSTDILNLIPLTAEIDQSSITAVLQALASIKTKILDNETVLTPYLISIRKLSDDSNLENVTSSFLSGYKAALPIVSVKNSINETITEEKIRKLKSSINQKYSELSNYFQGVNTIDQFRDALQDIYESDNDIYIYLIAYILEE